MECGFWGIPVRIDPFLVKNFEAEMIDRELHIFIDDVEYIVPHKIELCPNCSGEGKHLQTSLRNIAFSSEDEDYDPDFMEEMMNGDYDQRCDVCYGDGRIYVIDEELCDKDILEEINSTTEAIYQIHAEEAAERRYFGGY